jgi:hypothetical protein
VIEHVSRPPAGGRWPVESERARLARAARQAALTVSGVRGVDAGPAGTFVTGVGEGGRLVGVICVAAPGEGYEVSLSLVAGLVALGPLAERVRAAVVRVASFAGIAVAGVSVHFADVAAEEPG